MKSDVAWYKEPVYILIGEHQLSLGLTQIKPTSVTELKYFKRDLHSQAWEECSLTKAQQAYMWNYKSVD